MRVFMAVKTSPAGKDVSNIFSKTAPKKEIKNTYICTFCTNLSTNVLHSYKNCQGLLFLVNCTNIKHIMYRLKKSCTI